jgi:excisionase family DNA binding protein
MTEQRLTLTIEEAARLLGIGRGTAYAAARAGELPTIRLGRRVLVPRHKLAELVGDTNSMNSDAPAGETRATRKADAGGRHEAYRHH